MWCLHSLPPQRELRYLCELSEPQDGQADLQAAQMCPAEEETERVGGERGTDMFIV